MVAFFQRYVEQYRDEGGAFRLWTGSPELNGPCVKATFYIAVRVILDAWA